MSNVNPSIEIPRPRRSGPLPCKDQGLQIPAGHKGDGSSTTSRRPLKKRKRPLNGLWTVKHADGAGRRSTVPKIKQRWRASITAARLKLAKAPRTWQSPEDQPDPWQHICMYILYNKLYIYILGLLHWIFDYRKKRTFVRNSRLWTWIRASTPLSDWGCLQKWPCASLDPKLKPTRHGQWIDMKRRTEEDTNFAPRSFAWKLSLAAARTTASHAIKHKARYEKK